jgi:hypothetical protein
MTAHTDTQVQADRYTGQNFHQTVPSAVTYGEVEAVSH